MLCVYDSTGKKSPEELMKLKQRVIHGDPFRLSDPHEGIAIERYEQEGSKLHVFGRGNPTMNDWQAWVPAGVSIVTDHQDASNAGRNAMMVWVPEGVQVKCYRDRRR